MLNFIYVRNQRLKKALNKAWTIKIVNFSPINFKNNWTNDISLDVSFFLNCTKSIKYKNYSIGKIHKKKERKKGKNLTMDINILINNIAIRR